MKKNRTQLARDMYASGSDELGLESGAETSSPLREFIISRQREGVDPEDPEQLRQVCAAPSIHTIAQRDARIYLSACPPLRLGSCVPFSVYLPVCVSLCVRARAPAHVGPSGCPAPTVSLVMLPQPLSASCAVCTCFARVLCPHRGGSCAR